MRPGLIILLIVGLLSPAVNAQQPTALAQVKQALARQDYAQAVAKAQQALRKQREPQATLLYLEAVAFYHQKNYDQALATLRTLTALSQQNPWRHKAQFLMARILLERKDFKAASHIYSQQTRRLHSRTRKEQFARLIMQFAQLLARQPGPEELNAPPPDYNKAYVLYRKALELHPGPGLAEEITYRLGLIRYRAKQWRSACQEFQQYLTTYKKPRGKHYQQVHYLLGECTLASGQRLKARQILQDLINALGTQSHDPLLGKALWHLARTYGMPSPANETELVAGIAILQRYLRQFPGGEHSVLAAYQIAEGYLACNHTVEGIAALIKFIKGQGYSVGKENQAQREKLAKQALYSLGQLYFDQQRYQEAIATWNRYISLYPNGPHWAKSQQGILQSEYRIGEQLLAQKKFAQARAAWERFMEKYPLDRRIYRILFIFGQMAYQQACQARQAHQKYHAFLHQALQEWSRLTRKYPHSREAQAAYFRMAKIYEEELGELSQALSTYRRIQRGPWYARAQERIRAMTTKYLDLTTPRIFRTTENAYVQLRLRNIKKVHVRIYRLNLVEYFRKEHTIREIEKLDLGLIEPDKRWTVTLAAYKSYLPLVKQIEIPMSAAGVYAVTVANGQLEATTLVIRSDLDLIMRSSRQQALVFVQNSVQQKAAGQVRILLSDGSRVIARGRTGADGVWQHSLSGLDHSGRLSVLAEKDGHVASCGLGLVARSASVGLNAKAYIYTDRPAYRPGERVHLRAIVRNVDHGVYVVPDRQQPYILQLFDPTGKLLLDKKVRLSTFGTLHTSLPLSPQAPTGRYRITLKSSAKGRRFHGYFQVAHLRLATVRLTLKFDRRVYFRGEKIKGTFQAAYYYGQPLVGKPLRYTLPDGRSFVRQTDHKGQVHFTFDTRQRQTGGELRFKGRLETEGVRVSENVMLAHYGFSIQLQLSQSVILAGETVELSARTHDPLEQPVAQKLVATVYRKVTRRPDPILAALPWKRLPDSTWAEVQVAQQEFSTNEQGIGRVRFRLVQGGATIIRVQGVDRFGNPVVAYTKLFVSDDHDKTRLRILIPRHHLKVGEEVTFQLHSRLSAGLALVTFEGSTILDYRILKLIPGKNPLPLLVDHPYFPNFTLHVATLRANALYQAKQAFTVARELQVALHFDQQEYQPGQKGQLRITTHDHLGRPVKAEVSLALIDQALLAVHPGQRVPIVRFFQPATKRRAQMRTAASAPFSYHARTVKLMPKRTRPAVPTRSTEAPPIPRSRRRNIWQQARRPVPLPNQCQRVQRELNGPVFGEVEQAAEKAPEASEAEAEDDEAGTGAKGPERPQLRHESICPGWWYPAVVTNEQGQAELSVVMPQKITAWRLVAIGATVNTLVGQTQVNTVTRKDFFVTLKSPRLLREGDRPRFLVQIHNRAGLSGLLHLELVLQVGEQRLVRTQHLQLSGEGLREVCFAELTIPAGLKAQLQLTASLPAHQRQDALQLSLQLQPWGMAYADHAGGQAQGDKTLFLELPSGHYTSRWMTILLGPSCQQSIIDLALAPRPEHRRPDCASELANDLLACATTLQYLARTQNNQGRYARLLEHTRGLVAAAVLRQGFNGGWSWSGHTRQADLATTARLVWALACARQAGLVVYEPTLQKARRFLQQAFTRLLHRDNSSKAMVQHALATIGHSDFAYGNRLYRQRHSMGPAGLAYTALLLHRLKRAPMGREVLALLAKKKRYFKGGIFWPANTQDPWFANAVESTALAVLAFAQLQPTAREVRLGINYLLHQRRVYGFSPYRAKGPAVAALAHYFMRARYAQNDYQLSVRVNDHLLKQLSVRQDTASLVLQVPPNYLRPHENRVSFQLSGQGHYTYAVILRGFSPLIKDPGSWRYPYIRRRYYRHAPLEYQGRPLGVESTCRLEQLRLGERTAVRIEVYSGGPQRYFILQEPIPAGTLVVRDTLRGNFNHYVITPGQITFYFDPHCYLTDIRYTLAGYVPGHYRVLPTVLRLAHDPGRMRLGKSNELTVLAPGEPGPQNYQMNIAEHYQLGKLYFQDQHFGPALKHLSVVHRQKPLYHQRQVVKMLLWIHTQQEYYQAAKIVDLFETLKEKYPELYIPFEKILVVGQAYEDMQEYERAQLVYAATIAASFEEDAKVAGVLEDQGEFLGAIDYMRRLWLDYPDSPGVIQAHFGLSQALYAKSEQCDLLKENIRWQQQQWQRTTQQPTRTAVLQETIKLLEEFLCLYPQVPQSDDAAFSLTNAYLALDRFDQVVRLARQYRQLYPHSPLCSSFKYMQALGLFSQQAYDQAIAIAQEVAQGKSKDKGYATYILGQIYHARGNAAQAIRYYQQVARDFPDARECIAYFKAKRISLPEVSQFQPGQKIHFQLHYRNIKEAFLQIYRVDLMKLYLKEKNLAGITKVRLSGIAPVLEQKVPLGQGCDYEERCRTIKLSLKDAGAYLVICRGDDLFTSGLILVTPFTINVQEDQSSGRVRVYLYDQLRQCRPAKVHVKIIGTANQRFVVGDTDLRGIFIADGIRGQATVIARDQQNRYAFYRGKTWVGPPKRVYRHEQQRQQVPAQQYDFRSNLQQMNRAMQKANIGQLKIQMRRRYKGVQVEQTK